ncbi:uncharacterized protein LOC141664823 [Apium graveolens]|uniref:uncharacterized protein LOC141664823 n=1 Tax=Apium graveolens TaxID=4045 RepID=UPI003D7960D3
MEKQMLPLSKKEAHKVRYRAASYTTINGKLYRRSDSSPLPQYLDTKEQRLTLETVHEGICDEHLVGRALAFKILRQDFYSPTLRADAHQHAKNYKQCQLFSPTSKQPQRKWIQS